MSPREESNLRLLYDILTCATEARLSTSTPRGLQLGDRTGSCHYFISSQRRQVFQGESSACKSFLLTQSESYTYTYKKVCHQSTPHRQLLTPFGTHIPIPYDISRVTGVSTCFELCAFTVTLNNNSIVGLAIDGEGLPAPYSLGSEYLRITSSITAYLPTVKL